MIADGEIRGSSIATEADTTGTISVGSLVWMGVVAWATRSIGMR